MSTGRVRAARVAAVFAVIGVLGGVGAPASAVSQATTVRVAAQVTTSTIPVGANPYGVAVNPVTNKIYVTNENSGTVSVINGVKGG